MQKNSIQAQDTGILRNLSLSQKLISFFSFFLIALSILNSVNNWSLLGMTTSSFTVLMIFASSIILWLFVAVDWPSLLCLLLLGLLPEIGFKSVFQQSFGSSTFVFLTLTFTLSYCLQETPALKRLTARVLNSRWAGESAWRFVIAYLTVLLFMACFMSPTILFMIIFPIYEAICEQFAWQKGDKSAGILLFASYTVIAIGTAMTPINHVFAITAMGIYEEAYGEAISYGQYMSLAIPIGLILFLIILLSIRYIWRLDLSDLTAGNVDILDNLPAASKRETWIVGVFIMVIALWLLPELLAPVFPSLAAFFKSAGNTFPPLIGLIFLALLSIEGEELVKLPEALKNGVYWPSLLLVGSALALGGALTNPEIGLISWLKENLSASLAGLAPWLLILVFIAWAGIQTNLSSNLVTVTVVSHMAITILQSQNEVSINTAALISLVGFMASLAMMTPPAMPYVGISIGSKWLSSRQAFSYGLWILLWAIVLGVVAVSLVA